MTKPTPSTKILFVDENEASFQIWECIARALEGLPPLEFVYATDASDGLVKMEQTKPDVVVLNLDEQTDEARAFVDSLYGNHPPVIVHSLEKQKFANTPGEVIFVVKSGSLDGMHRTLIAATEAAGRGTAAKSSSSLH